MSMLEWAEKEVEIACQRENPDREEGEWDYGCACYESALKAYKSLIEDNHSGMSWSLTASILIRLMDGKPLTPIEDADDVWEEVPSGCTKDEYKTYQCKRMGSLFKHVYSDGTVKYNDVNRIVCVDTDNPSVTYHFGLVDKVIDEMYPIEMPYKPGKTFKVYCEEFLVDPENGDFDTVGILEAKISDSGLVYIRRYFKETESGWTEIDRNEYARRYMERVD